ncbi:hypothetical protein DM01DRAFT_1335881 [Hesseltinella vesiculosa]|uniref:C3H1-type domain-containing protein n=1 Tax=Hesseltinella vesiculosa TaxID=101127 RepID=A0A1X2GIT0_9FUNG|nr:hypothetical protein DM01DRAFT_1335881 [Hesseltinella vesiculosa]
MSPPQKEDLVLSSPGSPLTSTTSPPTTPFQHLSTAETHRMDQFDPFNSESFQQEDFDNLSNLLSRELLEDVESASSLPSPQPLKRSLPHPAILSTSSSSSTNTNHSPLPPPPSSTAFSSHRPASTSHSYSPIINTIKDTSTLTTAWSNHRLDTTTWTYPPRNVTTVTAVPTVSSPQRANDTHWHRFDPYGSEAEFDPTLPPDQPDNLPSSPLTNFVVLAGSGLAAHAPPLSPSTTETLATTQIIHQLMTLLPEKSEQDIAQTLASCDYDLERTMDDLLGASANRPSYLSPRLKAARSSLMATPPSTPRRRQVCRHYLAGECYRKDCWFSHDLEVKPCKFWLQGSCLKGNTCEFSHNIQVQPQPQQPAREEHLAISAQQPTVADFAVIISKSNRKSRKHNKKAKK